MEQFVILSETSLCRKKEGNFEKALQQDIIAFYHSNYQGGGKWRISGTIENLICTFKNDITPYPAQILSNAVKKLAQILNFDLPEILRLSGKQNLRVCVIPRAKRENSYSPNQLLLRATIQYVVQRLKGLVDGTHDIIRHTDTSTTHLARSGNGGLGELPYVGITKDTCNISDDIIGQDILLIDDLYTKTVNIDEDCIQALLDKGAKSVIFYSIGKTLSRY
ncbi:MAG: amidophosphoribosyltransferase [Bacteroidetes bacterium]|uniref:Amidophosphoribosyltransferase n=1 Tax=Candidatus Gallipaludibacter merdavium TaxID=2840839 RepID=A0A9D9HSA1_9BACT|nr:amidophosphoribosyltransferase [Candidatus Gallipaludibacter merdavium]